MRLLLTALSILAWVPLAREAHAARPFIVDDARVVDKGACQLESWRKNNADGSHEYWALPACNPFGVEITAGGGYLSRGPDVRDEVDYQFQGKYLFRSLETNGWGYGLSAGALRHADINTQQNLIGNYYFYFPISRSFLDDRFVLLLNLGAIDNRDLNRRGASWGVGTEIYLTRRFMLAAESYGAAGFDKFAQVGFRFWVVPDHVQLDASYGGNLGAWERQHWNSIGIRLISKPFF